MSFGIAAVPLIVFVARSVCTCRRVMRLRAALIYDAIVSR